MEKEKMEEKNIKSYLLFLTSVLIFGTIGIFRRYIPLSSGMLAFSRGLLGSLVLGTVIFIRKKQNREKQKHTGLDKKTIGLLAVIGVMTGVNWILLFEAYNYTSIATATMCYYMEPTIIILLSPILFKEHLTARKLACAGTAVIGMIFVSGVLEGDGIGLADGLGILFGLGAAVLYAVVVMLNKKVQVDDVYKKTMIQLMAAVIILSPYLLLTEDFSAIHLDMTAVIMVLIVGIVHTGIAYAMYYSSINGLKAQSIAVLSYLDPAFALILSAVVLHESMSMLSIAGALFIIGSAVVSER